MKIINPLYDQAFKYLMENNKFAKKVLSLILEVEIEEVTLRQQETVITDKRKLFNVLRMDFKAMIKDADGNRKTVLIEVQKSRHSSDIERFRNYLGSNYMASITDVDPVQEPVPVRYQGYPIVTIYFLGYNLPDLPYMAVTVNREVINSVSKETLHVKSLFIEHLTHQSHIIQVKRLPEKQKTRLERFLAFFNQKWRTEVRYILDLPEVPSGFADMARYLQSPLMDDEFRRKLRLEEEIDFIFDEQEAKYMLNVAILERQKQEAENQVREVEKQKQEAEKQKQEAEKQKQEMEKQKQEAEKQKQEAEKQKQEAEKQKQEAEKQKQEAEAREQEARSEKESIIRKFAIYQKQTGAGIEEIMKATGMSRDEVVEL